MKIFHFTDFIGSAEDNTRIHGTIRRLLSGVTDPDVRYYKLLNDIRYAGIVDNYSILAEIKELELIFIYFYYVVAETAITKKYDLLLLIKNNFPGSNWNRVIDKISILEHGIHIVFALIAIYTESEKAALFDGLPCIKWILKYYDLDYVGYNQETERFTLNLILTPELIPKGLPLTFKMFFKITTKTISRKRPVLTEIANISFDQHSERNEESLVRLLEGYKEIDALGFDYFSVHLKASSAFLKSVVKSDLLLNMVKSLCLQFSVDGTEFAKLLESDISSLRGILLSFPIRESLLLVKSFRQIRNLEAFLGVDISEIMMIHVIPYTEAESSSRSSYFKLSTALRYWLKSPQKHRMSELKANNSLFLGLLKNEVDLEDSKFLNSL